MANLSIVQAFERFWLHVVALAAGKADIGHSHDEKYYTKEEIDEIIGSFLNGAS